MLDQVWRSDNKQRLIDCRAAFSNTEKSSFILTRTFSNDATRHSSIHSSIYSLLHSLHWTSEISVQRSLSEIHSSIHSSNTPEDQLIETLFPNVYSPILPEDPFNSSSLFDHLFIDPSWTIYPEDHSSIYPEDHSSIHPEDALIDPYRRLIHSYHDPTNTPSNPVYRWTIGSPESDYIRGVNRYKSWVE